MRPGDLPRRDSQPRDSRNADGKPGDGKKPPDSKKTADGKTADGSSSCADANAWSACTGNRLTYGLAYCTDGTGAYMITCSSGTSCQCTTGGVVVAAKQSCKPLALPSNPVDACGIYRDSLCCAP